MTRRYGSTAVAFLLSSFLLTGLFLSCSHPRSTGDNGYSTGNPSSDQHHRNGGKQQVSLKELEQIRSAKKKIRESLPIEQIEWASHLGLEKNIVNLWTGPQYIYAVTEGHDLWAISRRSGNSVWTFSLDGPLKFRPTTVSGRPEQVMDLEKRIREQNETLSSVQAQVSPDRERLEELSNQVNSLQGRRRELRKKDYLFLISGTTMHVVDRQFGTEHDRVSLEFAASAQPYANTNRVLIPTYGRNFIYFFRLEDMSERLNERVRLDTPVETQINQAEGTYLFPTSGGTLYGYSTNGEWLWKKKTDGEIRARPKVQGDNVFVASRGMQVYSLSRFSGDENWTKHLERPISKTPWITESSIYVRDEKNRFFSIDISSGDVRWKHSSGPRSFLFENNKKVYTKNETTKKVFVLSGEDGEVVNSGQYKQFSYLLRNKKRPVFLLISKDGLMIAARASKVGREITTENIERSK